LAASPGTILWFSCRDRKSEPRERAQACLESFASDGRNSHV
jgi:hypothetical protein